MTTPPTAPGQRPVPIPWALSRLTPVTPTEVPFTPVALDPLTQTTIYRDRTGAPIDPVEAGKHGRITNTYTRTDTGDGQHRQPDSDTNVDGRPDPGGSL